MKNDFIEINEKQYRVEFNWNSITDFLESENLNLTDADDLKQLKPRQITGLIYAGIIEGCRIEKTEFPFSKLDFGAVLSPSDVGELLLIYQRQTATPNTKVQPGDKKKGLMNRFLSKSSSS